MRRTIRRGRSRRVGTCPPGMAFVGNVFVLGLATLIEELVDLQAANALEVLLEPFQHGQQNSTEQEVLAGDVQADAVLDLLDGFL